MAYVGFDPTASSLHLGNLLQILNMSRLQRAGHSPIFVAGGATGMIGDPSGKSEERKFLSEEELDSNLQSIKDQLGRFVDLSSKSGSNPARVVDNRQWLSELGLVEFLREIGKHFSVNQMIQKDSVRSRLNEREQGISYTEFSYMLLQSYDFLYLHDTYGCSLQIGASDQWGNITAGIDLIRRLRSKTVHGLASPLVTKADGTKFGKSEGGAIWLDSRLTSPFSLYQFFVRSEDEMIDQYLRFFTFLSLQDIAEAMTSQQASVEAREAHHLLAKEVVRIVHGDAEANSAQKASLAIYSGDLLSADKQTLYLALSEAPSLAIEKARLLGGLNVLDLFFESGLVASKGEARRLISQGGGYVNERRTQADDILEEGDLLYGEVVVLRRGKRDYCLVMAR